MRKRLPSASPPGHKRRANPSLTTADVAGSSAVKLRPASSGKRSVAK